MTLLPRRLPSPTGLEIRISFPRWLFRLILIGGGLLLVVGIIATVLFTTHSGGSDSATSFGMGVTGASFDGPNQRFSVEVDASPGSKAYPNSGWTVLLTDGTIVPARVVSGPARLAPGAKSHVVIEAGTKPGASPLTVRFDPDNQLGMSVPIASALPSP